VGASFSEKTALPRRNYGDKVDVYEQPRAEAASARSGAGCQSSALVSLAQGEVSRMPRYEI
jgi:hypothetical protein